MLGKVRDLGLTLLHFFFLSGLPSHDILDLIHSVMNIKCDAYGERHLVSVIYAHTEQALHSLEFLLVLCGNATASTFVNELNYTVRYILSLSINRPDQEILDLSGRALVVNLVLEFSLLGCIVRNEDLSSVEGLP